MQGQGQDEQRQRESDHVSVQIGVEEGEERELIDGIGDDAGGVPVPPLDAEGQALVAEEHFEQPQEDFDYHSQPRDGALERGAADLHQPIEDELNLTQIADEGHEQCSQETIADGLAATFAGQHTLAHVQAYVDELVIVSDEEIMEAMGLILERCKVVAEPAAAATLAALLSGKVSLRPGCRVVCVLSGGNVNRERLKDLL